MKNTIDLQRTVGHPNQTTNVWAVDCHVHLYEGYNIDVAVDSAWKNVQTANGDLPQGQCWCLAAPPGAKGLEILKAMAASQSSRTGIVDTAGSDGIDTLILEHEKGPIVVVPGTQAITSEGLEVLSLGAQLPDDGAKGLLELVKRVQAIGGLAVIPWGVGKWLGRRGRLVSRLVDEAEVDEALLLADNANRPWWWTFPRILHHAAGAGRNIVSGSDPLPIPGDETRIASAGVYCAITSTHAVWQQIRQSLIAGTDADMRVYGRPMSSVRFWRNQLLLRLRRGKS